MKFQCKIELCGERADTCPSKSLHQNPQYREPVAERVTISMKGKPRKKTKDKDKAKDAEFIAPWPSSAAGHCVFGGLNLGGIDMISAGFRR